MKDTGGPAFPFVFDDTLSKQRNIFTGATMRDYFAAKAMQSLIVSWGASDDDKWPGDAHLARESYLIADAMLEARKS